MSENVTENRKQALSLSGMVAVISLAGAAVGVYVGSATTAAAHNEKINALRYEQERMISEQARLRSEIREELREIKTDIRALTERWVRQPQERR